MESTLSSVAYTVKWSGKEIKIDTLGEHSTVLCLKQEIETRTGVKVARQKLLNLKHRGKAAEDAIKLSGLELKPGFKIMMMGSLDKEIEQVTTVTEDTTVIDDFDIHDGTADIPLEKRQEYQDKISKRVGSYTVNILNEPRPGKKLLVLDIDYTLFDHRSAAETGNELMRPFLHEFLTSAYEDYDIAIWSATSMKWIEEKMKLLGVASNPNYKIVFYFDSLIWGKFSEHYSAKNTIIIDDLRRNFLLNPNSGLKIRPFKHAHLNRSNDRVLLKLSQYLKAIAKLSDFNVLNHSLWEKYTE
uniref:Ubiquitin-like domain-containing CTD phosphatase 1 n=1 Tax=Lynceus sp. MCZ IZ 141354 TaxID=1930659 RepID=A0A9N6WRD3_9CRUS|nr:EOG090X0A5K [Lynceus sp. MCZ IZ 141354]